MLLNRCPNDGSGDFVEVHTCPNIPYFEFHKINFCQTYTLTNPLKLFWTKSCLIFRFFSNGAIVRNGFLVNYTFKSSKS